MTYQPPPPPPSHGPAFPPQGGVPHYGPPVAKKRGKTPWIIGGAVLLVLCCGGIGIAALSSGDDPAGDSTTAQAGDTGTEPAAKEPAKKNTPGLNDPARDGKFEFVVSKVKCGATTMGGDFLNKDAQGVFCLVDVTIRNIGNKAQMFNGSAQKAFNGDGTEFSHDDTAALYASEGNETFLNDINPGNKVAGTLVFDVPKGTKLSTVELHDSPFSGGVTVALK